MHIGAAMFFTEYSIGPAELARELEERGFESVWAPEHSHIPLSRKTPLPSGGELSRQYYDVMDPFVTLTAAAAVTKTIKVGTGVCLVIQRDTIQTAKLVASIDQVSGGRFLFGIGGGWNQDEMEDHGTVYATRFKKMREQIEAMQRDLDRDQARVSRRDRRFRADDDLAEAGAEAAPAGHRRRHVPARGAARAALRQRLDPASAPAAIRGRHRLPAAVPRNGGRNRPRPRRGAGHGVGRAGRSRPSQALSRPGRGRGVVQLAPEPADKTLPILDRWAELIRKL